ncbi:pyroglutamyl-peptidase I family protein [Scytonema millei]|uniref:Peptidase C15 n=1 Tax=Scytonema millei VB511283 TaxID=1245923 RepID=A0A9X5E885_9CYAN|nr:peptidase C15 [Scytonema millei]NHC36954.1 peptidase C15 [Scytonema millei VB511283]
MTKKILLTSFTTWLPHHTTNSSDDLLEKISQLNYTFAVLNFLRQLPVNIQLASNIVMEKAQVVEPNLIVCCGMAERRQYLSIESKATCNGSILRTNIDLEKLVRENSRVKISHDAGKFVCEGLYYAILEWIQRHQLSVNCVFVHVPILTEQNFNLVLNDFEFILQRLGNYLDETSL